MTIADWLSNSSRTLKLSGVTSYHLDALIMLEYVTTHDRAYLLAHQDEQLTTRHIKHLTTLLRRRIHREPIAYLLHQIEFYGYTFFVDKNVLIPRPESEMIVELALSLPNKKMTVLDVGCGTGALGISIKRQRPVFDVTLSDVSASALKIAQKNAVALQADVTHTQTNLFENLQHFDVVVANLPYVPQDLRLEPELSYEPPTALFADNDGMGLYEKFWSQIHTVNPTWIITESLVIQHEKMVKHAKQSHYKVSSTKGLCQLFVKT